MKETKFTPQARKDLDERFRKKWKRVAGDKRPAKGWVREIRESLGMSARQLGQMSGLKQSSISKIERLETQDKVQIHTLRKLGKAMGCELVYALVPEKPLDQILRDRAFSMLLPEILVPAARLGLNLPTLVVTEMVEALIKERKMLEKPRTMWEEVKLPPGFFSQKAAAAPKTAAPPEKKPEMSEDEIAALPPHVQAMAREGKVE